MPPVSGRNPASQWALTTDSLRLFGVGTSLLVCRMNDYAVVDPRVHRPAVRRIDDFIPVVYRGLMPRPKGRRDTGTGAWVILEGPSIEVGMSDMVEIKRRWRRTKWFAYEPAILGLCPWPSQPGWTDTVCVILPRYRHTVQAEYPRTHAR